MFEAAASVAAAESRPRERALLDRARSLPPGIAALNILERIDPAGLDEADRVDLAAAWEAQEPWLAARRHAAVLAVAGPSIGSTGDPDAGVDPDIEETSMLVDLAGALRVTSTAASRRVATARFLAAHPALARALSSAQLRYGHLAALERELGGATAATADAVIDEVLPRAVTEAPGRFAHRVRATLARVDAEAVAARARARARDRGCRLTSEPDLQARLDVTGPAPMMIWVHAQLDAWARQARAQLLADRRAGLVPPPDPADADPAVSSLVDVSLSALRADALVEAARLLAVHMGSISEEGSAADRPEVQPRRGRSWSTAVVVVPVQTALGVSDEPGHVPGYGPVPAAIARQLLASADAWRRFLVSDGVLRDTGSTVFHPSPELREQIAAHDPEPPPDWVRYRPGDRLRDLVTARDQTCTVPGCSVPAVDCDLDHCIPYDGANTHAGNVHALCRRHHRMKTHDPRWSLRRDGAVGTTTWTSPTGHRWIRTPDQLWDVGTGRTAAEGRDRRRARRRAGPGVRVLPPLRQDELSTDVVLRSLRG